MASMAGQDRRLLPSRVSPQPGLPRHRPLFDGFARSGPVSGFRDVPHAPGWPQRHEDRRLPECHPECLTPGPRALEAGRDSEELGSERTTIHAQIGRLQLHFPSVIGRAKTSQFSGAHRWRFCAPADREWGCRKEPVGERNCSSDRRPQAGVAVAGEVTDILRRDEDLITGVTDCGCTRRQDHVGVEGVNALPPLK